jgi:hypothetical protein
LPKHLEIHHTPERGIWLNIAEIELRLYPVNAWIEDWTV